MDIITQEPVRSFYPDHLRTMWPQECTCTFKSCPFSRLSFGGFYATGTDFADCYDLHQRAWCQQEFFLPSRVLQFGRSFLQWDCPSTSVRCFDLHETGRQPPNRRYTLTPATTSPSRSLPPKKLIQQEMTTSGNLLDGQRLQTLWDRWRLEVEVYSDKSLTVESDRLPAFSGVAQRFASLGASQPYIGGIWLADVWRQLCWWSFMRPGRQPSQYRAPTFSWASMEG